MGQQRDQGRSQKIPWNKWKWECTNLWDTGKTSLKGKLLTLQAYLKKQEKAQINNLNLCVKELEKEQQIESPRWVEGRK